LLQNQKANAFLNKWNKVLFPGNRSHYTHC